MGIPERRARKREEMRQMILDAARDLFVEKGVEAVTMREIAARIEYSPTAIYFHFRDKLTLLQELCATDFLEFSQNLARVAKMKDPVERLRKLGLSYVEFAVHNPYHYRFMFMTPFPEVSPTEESLKYKDSPDKDAYALLRNTVAEVIQHGSHKKPGQDVDLLAQVLWSAVHGICSLYIARTNDPWIPWRSVRKRGQVLIDMMLDGFLRKKAH